MDLDEFIQTLLPAALIAIVIRLDALIVGPYFSMAQLVGGMEDLDAAHMYSRTRIKFALVRRFLWPGIAAVVLGFVIQASQPMRGLLVGALAASLLLWPVAFHGLPWGVARNDWLLLPLYASVLIGFSASGWLGGLVAEFLASEVRRTGPRQYVLAYAVPVALVWAGQTLFSSSLAALREKRNQRVEEE